MWIIVSTYLRCFCDRDILLVVWISLVFLGSALAFVLMWHFCLYDFSWTRELILSKLEGIDSWGILKSKLCFDVLDSFPVRTSLDSAVPVQRRLFMYNSESFNKRQLHVWSIFGHTTFHTTANQCLFHDTWKMNQKYTCISGYLCLKVFVVKEFCFIPGKNDFEQSYKNLRLKIFP